MIGCCKPCSLVSGGPLEFRGSPPPHPTPPHPPAPFRWSTSANCSWSPITHAGQRPKPAHPGDSLLRGDSNWDSGLTTKLVATTSLPKSSTLSCMTGDTKYSLEQHHAIIPVPLHYFREGKFWAFFCFSMTSVESGDPHWRHFPLIWSHCIQPQGEKGFPVSLDTDCPQRHWVTKLSWNGKGKRMVLSSQDVGVPVRALRGTVPNTRKKW